MINYGKQNIDKKDINEVIKSLNQDLLTQGNYLKRLEKYSKNLWTVLCLKDYNSKILLVIILEI